MVEPEKRQYLAESAVAEHQISVRRAYGVFGVHRGRRYNKTKPSEEDRAISDALQELVQHHRQIGFWSCYYRLRGAGKPWNHKRVYRLYKQLGLHIRLRPSKRRRGKVQHLRQATTLNECWSLDFVHDSLYDGRQIRILNVMDDFNRQSLAVEIDTSLSAKRVVRVLQRLLQQHGKPTSIRTDNGSEFISTLMRQYCKKQNIKIRYIEPGKPTQNAYVERLNGSLRRELLDQHLFQSVAHAQQLAEAWQWDYNNCRPHQSLGYKTPLEFAHVHRNFLAA